MKCYTLDAPGWRETAFGDRYATVTLDGGRKLHLAVERDKRVRIPFKPRGRNYGWTYVGTVRDSATSKVLASDKVAGGIGARGLLDMAGFRPAPQGA